MRVPGRLEGWVGGGKGSEALIWDLIGGRLKGFVGKGESIGLG